jgi:hypothetical protein
MHDDTRPTVAAIFHDVPHFQKALEMLQEAGFAKKDVSILGPHAALIARFGRDIPPVRTLEDDPETPREPLSRQGEIKHALDLIGDALGIVSMLAVAGASFFVGGPIGVASQSGTNTDLSVDAALERYVDHAYLKRYQEAVADGGLIAWVHAEGTAETARALDILKAAGGTEGHAL